MLEMIGDCFLRLFHVSTLKCCDDLAVLFVRLRNASLSSGDERSCNIGVCVQAVIHLTESRVVQYLHDGSMEFFVQAEVSGIVVHNVTINEGSHGVANFHHMPDGCVRGREQLLGGSLLDDASALEDLLYVLGSEARYIGAPARGDLDQAVSLQSVQSVTNRSHAEMEASGEILERKLLALSKATLDDVGTQEFIDLFRKRIAVKLRWNKKLISRSDSSDVAPPLAQIERTLIRRLALLSDTSDNRPNISHMAHEVNTSRGVVRSR